MAQKMVAQTGFTITNMKSTGSLGGSLGYNLPLTVRHDPNGDNTYIPDWSKTNLVVTPIVAHNASPLTLTSPTLSILWKRREGSGAESNLTTGETVSAGILTVNQNKLASIPSGLITYICYVEYTLPNTAITLNHQMQVTFNLSTSAMELHYCSIDGENAFLYDKNGTLTTPSNGQITLNATVTNVNISSWQYKKQDGTFAAYPSTADNATINSSILKIKPAHPIFFNNAAVIKLVTTDANVTDVITVVKIYDGSPSVIGVLSNETHILPANSSGVVSSYVGADSTMSINEGGVDVSASWSVTAVAGAGVTGSLSGKTYTVTGVANDTGYVDFTATRSGYSSITKRFTLTKNKNGSAGASARVYFLEPSTYVINKNISNVLTPAKVSFTSFYREGTTATRTAYNGRFIIAESTDGSTWVTKYTSSADENTKEYTPSTVNIKSIKCTLYASGGTTTALDTSTTMVTNDGEGGTTMLLGNEAVIIPCNTSGNVLSDTNITIPFTGYIGIKRAACTCTVGTLPSGITVVSNTSGTASAPGTLTLKAAANATLGTSATMTGTIDLTLTCNGLSIINVFTWTKNKQASDGTSAVLFQLYAPQGDIIINNGNTVVLNTQMYNGSSIVTPSKYVWKKLSGGSYIVIAGQTASSLTIKPDMVDSMASFCCVATYGGKDYTAYWTVYDRVDNIQATPFNSLGDKIENGKGSGIGYIRVFQNSNEIDELKSDSFLETAPSSPTSGMVYYHINKSAHTVTLKKWNGTAWIDQTGSAESDYEYKLYRLVDGNSIDTTPWKSSKVFWIDQDAYGEIGTTTNFNVEIWTRE